MTISTADVNKTERIEVLHNTEIITRRYLQIFYNATNRWDYFADIKSISIVPFAIDSIAKAASDAKGRGVKLRFVTEITKDNLYRCKQAMKIAELRHLDGVRGNFGVSDTEYIATTIATPIESNLTTIPHAIYSNVKEDIQQQQYVFEILWNKAIPAEQKMREIEEGAERTNIEVIPNSDRARKIYLNLVKNAESEIMLMFPTTNAFIRQEKIGAIELCKKSIKELDIKVRILMPTHKSTEQMVQNIREQQSNIDVRYIEQTSGTQATFLVIDRKASLVMEIKDDLKTTFDDAIGLSTYSNSKAGVLSYISIFENLWKQTELYEDIKKAHEQLKIHDKMQKEFINIAAHELRTPIQPILGLSELLISKTGNIQQYKESLDTISRNAKRLSRLTDDILDATKIESKSLLLKKELFNLNDVILNALDDIILSRDFNGENVRLLYHPQDILLEADKGRITQVISNLLSNAVKFTEKGTINITTKIDEDRDLIVIGVKDTGTGIDPEILPKLFSKFAAKSFSGTGLGLFISKSIVEAHGGKIWVENNANGRGTTFYFTLPLANS